MIYLLCILFVLILILTVTVAVSSILSLTEIDENMEKNRKQKEFRKKFPWRKGR